ncbi:MAG: AAA family ATPase [Stenomitos rutilans HA7619-LM2]|jgi:tetratricopeptide (TPR) repeat protein|nr:AAA family ATPase [Stenomitos rutilans HA7619-LM2]
MNAPKRSRARVLTPEGLQKLRERVRSHEVRENAGFKYTLERLGELTGLDPETVKNVLDCKGSDKRTIARCFENFGLTLNDSDHIPATQTTAIADPNFVGRDEAIADLSTLVSRNAKVIVIQARGGVGKTTLARKYLQQAFGSFLEFPIAKETKDIASIEGLLEEKLRQLGEEPGREFLVSLDRLKRKLQAERLGILIDNLEPALDSAGKFIEAHRRYVELLRVLSDPTVQSLTLITSRERLREADVTVQHYSLRSLDVQAWEQFFQSRSINTDTPALATLHDAYGGNAKAMDIISGTVLEDFSGDVEAYWQVNQSDLFIERDLEDLVIKQFNRLQELDPDAYKLLCRMGCYRYQDVPTVPIEGLFCLLWDVPENRHRRVIRSLQDRSLVDFEDGEFWLHPVIRAEAVSQLRMSDNSELTNRKAAEFWTETTKDIENIDDALTALEAYYHYVEIDDFSSASYIVTSPRPNQKHISFGEGEALGGTFYRLGLTQQMIFAITGIINKIPNNFSSSKMYHFLGDLSSLSSIVYAEKCYKKSGEIADEILKRQETDDSCSLFKTKAMKIESLFNIGLCKANFWQLQEAIFFTKEALASLEKLLSSSDLEINIECKPFQKDFCQIVQSCSWSHLGFLYSEIHDAEQALFYAEQAFASIYHQNGLNLWAKPFSFVSLGCMYQKLGMFEASLDLHVKTLSNLSATDFPHIRAKALNGIAFFHREHRSFEESFPYHFESIQILEAMGAKCDLAEAYYQIGLTYQAMSDAEKSYENFQKAIRLFGEMEAPKQVEKVRRSMQNSL